MACLCSRMMTNGNSSYTAGADPRWSARGYHWIPRTACALSKRPSGTGQPRARSQLGPRTRTATPPPPLLHRRIGGTNVPGEIVMIAPTPETCREWGHEHAPRDDGLLAYISHKKGVRVQSRGNTHTRTCDMTFTAVSVAAAYRMVGDDPPPSVTPTAAPSPPAVGPAPSRTPPPPPTTPPRPRRGNPPVRHRPAQVGLFAAQVEQRARL